MTSEGLSLGGQLLCCFGFVLLKFLPESRQCGEAFFCYGADPLAGVHMSLHEDKSDRFVDITAGKDGQHRQVQHKACDTNAWDKHGVHEGNLKNCARCGISGRTVGIILGPVAHTDNGSYTVDEKHSGADPQGFAGKAHNCENRFVDGNQSQA